MKELLNKCLEIIIKILKLEEQKDLLIKKNELMDDNIRIIENRIKKYKIQLKQALENATDIKTILIDDDFLALGSKKFELKSMELKRIMGYISSIRKNIDHLEKSLARHKREKEQNMALSNQQKLTIRGLVDELSSKLSQLKPNLEIENIVDGQIDELLTINYKAILNQIIILVKTFGTNLLKYEKNGWNLENPKLSIYLAKNLILLLEISNITFENKETVVDDERQIKELTLDFYQALLQVLIELNEEKNIFEEEGNKCNFYLENILQTYRTKDYDSSLIDLDFTMFYNDGRKELVRVRQSLLDEKLKNRQN